MPQVELLASDEQYQRYVAFAAEVYKDNPYWRPEDPEHLVLSISNKTPFASHSIAQPLWVRRGEQVVATVTAVVDERFNNHWKQRAGHLLLFEALPDAEEEARLLLHSACAWLRNAGCDFARFGFLYGWQIGATIDAYDVPPTIFHPYNPRYYHRFVKNAGFATERGLIEYQVQFTHQLEASYREMALVSGVSFRRLNKSEVERDTEVLCALFNETFAGHWGAAQFAPDEFSGLTAGLGDLLPQEFVWIAEADGKPAGFVYSLPDLNQLPDVSHGVLLVIGVREPWRGKGLNLALAAHSFLAMIERGYQSASYTVVLDDNRPSRRTAEKLGCRVARNFVVYRRELE